MNTIAIVRRNGLGDLLCAYPLVLYLQKKFPSSKITLFGDKRNAPLIPYLPPVNEVVIFPGKGNKYWNLYQTARQHRKKFDLALSAKTSPMKLTNLFLYWLKAKKRVAYVDSNWHGRLINSPLIYDATQAKQMHQALKGLKTVAPELDDVPSEFYPHIIIPKHLKREYQIERVSEDPVVLVSATTTKESSRFDIDRYAALLNRLHRVSPIFVRIVGQKQDELRANAISDRLQMPNHVHFPRNFDAFMVLLDACDLYFVGDGGVAHIGAALGKKEVALFGETSPIEWRPLSKEVEIFYHPTHINHLPDDEIFQALKRKLNEVMHRG